MTVLTRPAAVAVFLAFAFAYFFSALVRAVTATLSPTLTAEFALNSRDLGLLAGGYFLGFTFTQLPLGTWLDQYGPKRVSLGLLAVAVAGCLAFSMATSFTGLLAARVMCGVGLSACLMAPLTGYRRWFDASTQMRANSWMLMTGSMGMVASTLPVQWLLPLVGWRVMFWGLAALVLLAMAVIAWQVPGWLAPAADAQTGNTTSPAASADDALVPTSLPAPGYAEVWRHPYFRKLVPLGFFSYGGLVAMQTLWAAPWMVNVAGYTPLQAATGLFWLNVAMLCTFWLWGMANPWLARQGIHADRLMARGLPLSFVFLAIIIIAGESISTGAGVLWALYCVSCTFVSLSQPAVALAFSPAMAGRALSAYNLVIFAGVFVVQWGIGLGQDGFRALGLSPVAAFQASMAVFLGCCVVSHLYFLMAKSHNQPT